MSKVRLYGSTSGYVELAAPAVAPDATLTLPATAGGFGKVVDLQHVLKTDTQVSSSIAAGGSVAISGLSITHTVADAANRVVLFASVGMLAEAADLGGVAIRFAQDGTAVSVGDAAGSRTRSSAGGGVSSGATSANYVTRALTAIAVLTPGAGSKVYTVEAINNRGSTQTLYVNRSEADSDDAAGVRSTSTLTLVEVAA